MIRLSSIPMLLRRIPRLTMVATTLTWASAAAQLARPVVDRTPGGIPRVMSVGPTAWRDTLGWKFVLDHVVQPPEGAAGELGNPEAILLLPDGRVYASDQSPVRIQQFDAQGRFVRTIGREGDGPGEYRQPSLAGRHGRLLVQDPQQQRLSLFTEDGRFLRSFPSTCCNFGPPPFIDDQRRIATASFSMKDGKPRSAWVRFDSLGKRLDSLPFPEPMAPVQWTVTTSGGVAKYSVPLAPRNVLAQLTDGGFAFGRTDRYEIMVSRTGRDTSRIFGRSGVKALSIPSAYRDSLFHARTDRLTAAGATMDQSQMPRVFELWRELAVDGAGNFWVSAGGKLQGPPRFDVFAPAGDFLGTVPAPWSPGLRTSWAGDRVAVLDTDDADLPRIRVFRITRNIPR